MASGFKRVYLTPLTAVETTDKEGLGTLRFEGNKVYKWVKILNTTATVAGVAGDAVAYAAATGHNTNTVVIDASDADANPVLAGLLQGSVTGTAGTSYYGWIQIKGPATAAVTLAGTPADGDMLMMSTTDKTLTKFVLVEGTPNTLTSAPLAIATDASANLVALDCPF